MLSKVVTNPENVKKLIAESGVYETAPDIFVGQFLSHSSEDIYAYAGIESENDVKEITNRVLPSEWLKENTEIIIDSFYDWLEGETENPEFTIDVADRQNALVDEFAQITKDNLQELPTCTEGDTTEFNPFSATCIPSGFDLQELEKQIDEQLASGKFFEETEVSSDQFLKIDETVTKNAQRIYSVVKNLHKVVLGVIVVLSLVLFLLLPGISNKFFVIGVNWTVSGSALMFANLLANSKFESFYSDRLSGVSVEQREIVDKIIKAVIDVSSTSIWRESRQYAVVIIVLGVVFIIGGLIMKFSKGRYYMSEDKIKDKPKKEEPEKVKKDQVIKETVKKEEPKPVPRPEVKSELSVVSMPKPKSEIKLEPAVVTAPKPKPKTVPLPKPVEEPVEKQVIKPVVKPAVESESESEDALSEVEEMEKRLNMKGEELSQQKDDETKASVKPGK